MKKIVKSLCITGFSLVLVLSAKAQLQLPGNALGHDLKKVIRDYPNQFSHLQGDVLQEKTQATDYELNFHIDGAESSIITKYSAKGRPVVSCEALLLTTEDFEEACRKYRSVYALFNHMAVKMDNGVTFYLKGDFQKPVEERKFSSSVLAFEKADAYVSKMKVEVSLQYEYMEWKVRFRIYEREREDSERGDMIDEEEL
ncbi:MAG: hypothetical protein EOO05_12430 [Chitinophagaceae bacterium]|nr:MAG: hypothetical protein EOO05_12430 [Chitinophagaceae bacterium]